MGKGLDFGLLGGQDNIQTSDYRSAGSHQAENLKYLKTDDQETWHKIHTVTTGKTFYVSGIVIATQAAATVRADLGTGGAGSQTQFYVTAVNAEAFGMALPTPAKFSSGTEIWCRTSHVTNVFFTLIGWEE